MYGNKWFKKYVRCSLFITFCRTQQCTTTITVTIITSNTYLRSNIVKVFVGRPTLRASMAQGLFLGGTGRRAVAHTRPEFPKMPTAPSAFPLLGAPQAPGDKPNLPEGSKSLGGRPPEAVGNTPQAPRHTRPDPRLDATAGQSATQHLKRSWPRAICCQRANIAKVFVVRPTLRASMAQGLFLGGTGRRAVAHTRPEFPKMPTAPSAFPLLGAPQAPGDKPNLPEGSKSLGGRPPEAVGNTPQAPRHTRPDPRLDATAGQSATQHLKRSWPRAICCQRANIAKVFVVRPTLRASMAQGLFLGGTGRRAVAHTRPEFPKMPTAPSAFPLLGAPQAPGDKPNLPEGSKSLGGRPPEAVGNTPQAPRHTRPDPRLDATAGQSATQHLKRSWPRAICCQRANIAKTNATDRVGIYEQT